MIQNSNLRCVQGCGCVLSKWYVLGGGDVGMGGVRELKLKFKYCVPLHNSERKRFKFNSDKNKGLNFIEVKQFINHKRINVN